MTTSLLSKALLATVATGALAFAGCGSGSDEAVQKLQKQGEQLRQQGAQLQQQAQQTAADVQAGRKTPEQATAELQQGADKLKQQSIATANDVVDAVQKDDRIPDSAKRQLEDAQAQLNQQTP